MIFMSVGFHQDFHFLPDTPNLIGS